MSIDDNTKDVLIVALGILGTVAGVVLGGILEARRERGSRFLEEKRVAYALLLDAVEEDLARFGTGATRQIGDRDPDALVKSASTVALVGSRAVMSAAQELTTAMVAVIDSDGDDSRLGTALATAKSARTRYMNAARKDLGTRD